jgi:protein transport protein HofC
VSRNPWQPDESVKKAPAPVVRPPRIYQFRLVHMMELTLGIALLCAIGMKAGPLLLVATPVLIIGGIIGLIVLLHRRKTTQQDALLWVMSIAADRQMPLDPALAAFAEQCGGRYRRKVNALAEYLAMGSSLPDALERVPGVLPRDAELLARVGWETGTLPSALREAAAARTTLRPSWGAISSRIAYFFWVLYIIQTITSFIMYFIIPKFEAIFKDFGLPLPSVTIYLISASHLFFMGVWLVPLIGLAELALLIYLPLTFFGWENYHVPFIDRLFIRRHTTLLLRCLSWVVEGGKPLTWGVELLARYYPTRWVRRRLDHVAEDLAHGHEWTVALARQNLVRNADVVLLESAVRVGNLPWALRETAESGERRLAYRLQMVVNTLFPVVIIALGMLVGLIAVAFFVPLVSLIERLV